MALVYEQLTDSRKEEIHNQRIAAFEADHYSHAQNLRRLDKAEDLSDEDKAEQKKIIEEQMAIIEQAIKDEKADRDGLASGGKAKKK